ncbi:MAG: hypothetical protein OXI71_11655 [Gemmatimonadota bacterium]|nr:hypothetical protein [Gemmatimonadota bacterium]
MAAPSRARPLPATRRAPSCAKSSASGANWGILHRAVKKGRTVRIEGMFRIRTKKREPYAKRLPSGRVVAVRGKLEPKITASPGFKDYISAFGTAPPE